jgi:hypothetical protein
MACNAPDLSEQDSVPVGHPPGVHGVESKIQFKKKGKRKSCHFYGVSIFRVPFMIFFFYLYGCPDQLMRTLQT